MNGSSIYTMTIELRSDMCCGTGESDGVAVDQVTALDSLGLPYIPAKRLKGLLREEAEIVAEDDAVASLFGKSGASCPGKLRFSDAQLVGYAAIADAVRNSSDPISPKRVSAVFTTTRSSTRIDDDGVAADHSLRTTQLVKRCDSEGTPTKFTCRVLGENLSSEEKHAFDRSVNCLRSIGMNKSRGFGEVKCSGFWEDAPEDVADARPSSTGSERDTVSYRIRLESDAVLQGGPRGALDFIPGSMVQGLFAKELCREAPDLFQEHVLRNTRFSNAYLAVAEGQGFDEAASAPVPLTFKAEKNYPGRNRIPLHNMASGELPSRGESDKPVQWVPVNGYGAYIDGEYVVADVDERYSFHSSKATSEQGKQFYSLRSISSGQSFVGTITASAGALAAFRAVVNRRSGRFSVGNAGSAGYGACHFEFCETVPEATISLNAGDRVAIRFVSDVVFVDGSGSNTTDVADFAEQLSTSGALGFSFETSMGAVEHGCRAFVKNATIGGYNAHWRLPKRQYMTFAAGSVLVVTVSECVDKAVPSTAWTGLLQTEGYGQLRLERIEEHGVPTYSKGYPAYGQQHVTKDGAGEAGNGAIEAFRRELAYVEAGESIELVARDEATLRFRGKPSSKSSAMRIGSLFMSSIKNGSDRPIDAVFDESAKSNFGNDDVLLNACKNAVERFREFEKAHAELSSQQKRLLFISFMTAYLNQVKQLFTMAEGGRS